MVEVLLRTVNGYIQALVILAVLAPYGVALATVGLGAHLIARSRVGAACAAIVLVAALAGQVSLYVGHDSQPNNAARFKILTANLRLGQASATRIVALAESQHVDAIALQELTPNEVLRLIGAGLQRDFPYSEVAAGPDATGVGLWSKHPLTDATSYPGFTFHEVSARIALDTTKPEDSFELFSTHIVAPWPGPTTLWANELNRLGQILGAQKGTTIDAGDFNSTTDLEQFRELLGRTGYRDAVLQSGAGLIPTFPTDAFFPPLIAIDHVLSHGATSTSVKSVDVPGSDHRGLVVELLLPSLTDAPAT